MIKILISGCKGRVGSRIARLVENSSDLKLVAGVDIDDSLEPVVEMADVIVNFSVPKASAEHAGIAAEHKKPIVIGTTGLNDEQESVLRNASKKIPIVYTPNMSMGVNVMYELIRTAAKALSDKFDIDIEETHHANKADKPSGTAKRMTEIAIEGIGMDPKADISYFDGAMPMRKQNDRCIRVCSVREGDVVGDHRIRFQSNEETLSINHHAKDRDVFAKGALAAARWIIGKPAGLYGMNDVLNLDA